jgi:hypothetical protein
LCARLPAALAPIRLMRGAIGAREREAQPLCQDCPWAAAIAPIRRAERLDGDHVDDTHPRWPYAALVRLSSTTDISQTRLRRAHWRPLDLISTERLLYGHGLAAVLKGAVFAARTMWCGSERHKGI